MIYHATWYIWLLPFLLSWLFIFFGGNDMVPHVAARKNTSAALEIFIRHPKKTFSTLSGVKRKSALASSTSEFDPERKSAPAFIQNWAFGRLKVHRVPACRILARVGQIATIAAICRCPRVGKIRRDVLERLKDYIMARLDEPIEVGALANVAGRSPFHFTRVFTKSVGLTPHRYVVHLRLRRAIELARGGRQGLVEIAACTGFADQSHLSRWVRRVHGVSITQLLARP